MAKRLIRRRNRTDAAKAVPATPDTNALILKALQGLSEKLDGLVEEVPESEPETEPETDAAPDDLGAELEDEDLRDNRDRSRKVYFLAPGAMQRTNRIPERPSSARRCFRYLSRFDAATVKQMAVAMTLEKKTIGNGMAALMQAKLATAIDIPKA